MTRRKRYIGDGMFTLIYLAALMGFTGAVACVIGLAMLGVY